MKQIVDFLRKSGMQYFATIGLDGKPKVRPFQFMFEEEGKLWFCTSNQKEVYKEVLKQPYVELCASGPSITWLRLNGKVVFSDSLAIKEKVIKTNALVKSIYKKPDNPGLEVFFIDEMKAYVSGIGIPTQKI